jgi:hypothetical protein
MLFQSLADTLAKFESEQLERSCQLTRDRRPPYQQLGFNNPRSNNDAGQDIFDAAAVIDDGHTACYSHR